MRQWHLIYDMPMPGPRNMAVDEMLLQAVGAGKLSPVLRFYAWNPHCLSLGYGQSARDADSSRIRACGWDLVRRISGGKAILHGDEFTYSLILPIDHPLASGDIVESYQRISRALLHGLAYLGLQTSADKKTDGVKVTGPVCFEVPSHYEIVTGDGRKLIGSAQVRRKTALMQHGTLPLHGDIGRIVEALVFESDYAREEARGQVRARAVTLADALDHRTEWYGVAEAMRRGFEDVFGVSWLSGSIVDEHEVSRLIEERYGNDLWTLRR
jgi:lipoate-protein ligase A